MPSTRSGTKFTAEVRSRVLEGIRIGLPIKMAAARAGIAKQTLYNWLAEAEKKPDGAYGKFAAELDLAQADFAAKVLGHWNDAIPDDWRAGVEMLGRRFPDEFGKRERHEVSGPAGEAIKVEVKWPGAAPE